MQTNLIFGFSTNRVDEIKPNKRITFAELRDIITNKTSCPSQYDELPALAEAVYIHGGGKPAKDKLTSGKRFLPWVTFQGFCPTGHSDATIEYNSCLQIDWDIKTPDGQKRALDFLQKIKEVKPAGVLFAGISPSTFGVKILMTTTATDKGQHKEAATQAIKYLAGLFQIDESEFDACSKTLSQPCFIPYERTPGQHFWQPDATKFNVCLLPAVVDDHVPQYRKFEIHDSATDARLAAEYLATPGNTWTVDHRNYFLGVLYACKMFPDGESLAWNMLENCPQWGDAETRKDWAQNWRSTVPKKNEDGTVIMKRAYRAGWVSPQQKAAREWKEEKARRENERKESSSQNSANLKPKEAGLQNSVNPILPALPGEYLADVLQRHGLPLDFIIGRQVTSPTGSGKTSLVAELVKQCLDRKFILIVPTIALSNRVCEKHPDAVLFVGGTRKLNGNERFIVTTAQSFPALASRINLREWDVVFDESHGFTADTARGYKLKSLRRFHAIAKDLAKSVTYLTGTHLYNFHPDFLKLERLQITAPQRLPKSAKLVDANHVLATSVQAVRAAVDAGSVAVFFLNDKFLKLAEVKHALQDFKLAILNSETKEDALFQQITKTGAIPAGIQVIVTTSVFKEGNDIHDGRAFDFIVVGAHHSSAIEQLSARARNASEVRVQIIRHDQRTTNSRQFDPVKYADLVAHRAQALCDEQNNLAPTDDTAALFFERNLRRAIQYTPVQEDDKGLLQVDFFGVNNEVFLAETMHEYQNDAYLVANLEKYGFKVDATIDTSDLQHESELQAGIKEARESCKEQKQAAHLAAVETLQKAINPATLIMQAENAGKVPKAYKFAKELHKEFGIGIREAVELLPEVDTPKKFALLKNQITVDCLRSNDAYLKSGRIVGLIIQKIDATFTDGMTASAGELRKMLYQCLSLDRSINLDFLSPDESNKMDVITANRKAVALLKMFFEVEHSGRDTKRMCHRNKKFTLRKEHSFSDTIPNEQKQNVDFGARVERSFLGALIEDAPF